MSIATRTGDDGSTGLMYNRRVSKTDVRVEAYGSVDELNAALGMARSASQDWKTVAAKILVVQEQLVVLMGELATSNDDRERYVKDGFHLVTSAMTHILDDWIQGIESQKI